jgi:putative ABC transport system substrate-binding protein
MKVAPSIPLVGIDLESDPVASGFVKSLAHPGLNISGIWLDLPELAGKQLQFLQELTPALIRVGVVWDDQVGGPQFAETQSAARVINVKLAAASLRRAAEADYETVSILKLIETNLAPLGSRDAAANNLLNVFDFSQTPR